MDTFSEIGEGILRNRGKVKNLVEVGGNVYKKDRKSRKMVIRNFLIRYRNDMTKKVIRKFIRKKRRFWKLLVVGEIQCI